MHVFPEWPDEQTSAPNESKQEDSAADSVVVEGAKLRSVATQSEAEKFELFCERGHLPLRFYRQSDRINSFTPGWKCDGCLTTQAELKAPDDNEGLDVERFKCVDCDYVLCVNCAQRRLPEGAPVEVAAVLSTVISPSDDSRVSFDRTRENKQVQAQEV
jgi:hypothetical protein